MKQILLLVLLLSTLQLFANDCRKIGKQQSSKYKYTRGYKKKFVFKPKFKVLKSTQNYGVIRLSNLNKKTYDYVLENQ